MRIGSRRGAALVLGLLVAGVGLHYGLTGEGTGSAVCAIIAVAFFVRAVFAGSGPPP